jgi:putative hydrolase
MPPAGPFGLPLGGPIDFSKLDPSQVDFAQLFRILQSPGPVNWEIARQTAEWVALEGRREAPTSSADRQSFSDLAQAAQTLVVAETGLTATFATPVAVVGRQEWVDLHLVALKPVLEALAQTLGDTIRQAAGEADEEETAQTDALLGSLPPGAFPFPLAGMGSMMGMLAPALLGVQAGSMIGYLAQHALGRYDLPLPTGAAPSAGEPGGDVPSLIFVVGNVDEFEAGWSLPRDDLRFYLALHEVVHAAMRSVPWVRSRLVELAVDYVSSYAVDPDAFEAAFGDIDPSDPSSMQQLTAHPELVLGAMQSPGQRVVRAELARLTSVLAGYADTVLARVGRRLIPSFDQIHEAMARHHVDQGDAGRFIEGLLGLKLERAQIERGRAFCDGVVERGGLEGLTRLFEHESRVPTENELDAPGLWLARIDLPGT